MRRAASLALVLVAAIGFAGCSSHKTTVQTDNGTATVTTSQDNQTTTVQTGQGSVSIGKGAVDPSKLGAPVYPGASQDSEGGMSMNGSEGSGAMAAFKTTDPFDKVYDYYKGQLPAGSEKLKVSQGDSSMASFQIGDDKSPDQTTVMITAKNGETDILITHGLRSGQGQSN